MNYIYRLFHKFPLTLAPTGSVPLGVKVVVLISIPVPNMFRKDIISTLQGDFTALRGTTVQCQSSSDSSEVYYIQAYGK